MEIFTSISPYTGEQWAVFPKADSAEVNRTLDLSHRTFLNWRWSAADHRISLLLKLAEQLDENLRELAQGITNEMGKPIVQSEAEIRKCIWLCRYYAGQAPELLRHEYIAAGAVRSYVRKDPMGTVLAIMPWNFPFWQAMRCAIPAILAGNTVIHKPAPNVPTSAIKLRLLFLEAGFPEGVFTTLLADVSTVESVIRHPHICGVAFTGSTQAGASVASMAGQSIKPVVLELGGSDAFIVLSDANLGRAVAEAVQSRFRNAGQSCIAAKRIIVVKDRYDEFCQMLVTQLKTWKAGDPLLRDTDIGPMVNQNARNRIRRQYQESVAMGANILWEHPSAEHPCFFSPAVINNTREDMPCMTEETFGPLAVIARADNEQHTVELANKTHFGLGASLWTEDLAKAEHLARFIDSGTVVINEMVQSDPRLPFGGTKQSGIGRELGRNGLESFVNLKTVMVHKTRVY